LLNSNGNKRKTMNKELQRYWDAFELSDLVDKNRNKSGYVSPHNIGYGLFRHTVRNAVNTVPKDLRDEYLQTFVNKDLTKITKWYKESKAKEWRRYSKKNTIDKNKSYYLNGYKDIPFDKRPGFEYK
tara:strand:- start:166 stop:546 length:381 start_codon:yes stop_codon:yes gene_type:complete